MSTPHPPDGSTQWTEHLEVARIVRAMAPEEIRTLLDDVRAGGMVQMHEDVATVVAAVEAREAKEQTPRRRPSE